MNQKNNDNNDLKLNVTSTYSPVVKLSKRQEQVLDALSKGLIYKEIAHLHHISENTVAYHMMELRKKLSCKNSREILTRAEALGLTKQARTKNSLGF